MHRSCRNGRHGPPRRLTPVLAIMAICLCCAAPAMRAHGETSSAEAKPERRPNVLFAFADDWGRYASAYAKLEPGGPSDVIHTPHFDRVAREGVLFTNAFVNAPSCTPCRSSILSGQYFWRTGLGAILQGAIWDESIPSYPLILRDGGYHIGHTYKVWSPGTPRDAPYGGRDFLAERGGRPFDYWFGPTNTHRKWIQGSGLDLWGINPDDLKGKMPPYLPDIHTVREDFGDSLGEGQAFDASLGVLIAELERIGKLDNRILASPATERRSTSRPMPARSRGPRGRVDDPQTQRPFRHFVPFVSPDSPTYNGGRRSSGWRDTMRHRDLPFLLAVSCFAGATVAAVAAERPNIVLIYTDDQDLDEIGCYGGRVPTPHMDGLARDGMKFTRYYVCSAVCSPSRYNALSGRCASRSLKQQGRKYPPGGPVNIGWEAGIVGEPHTVASVLKAGGYATGMVGKWHQGMLQRTTGFAADANPEDPEVKRQLERNYEILVRSVRSCGFDYAGAVYLNNVDGGREGRPFWIPRKLGYHNMEWVTACALEFIEKNQAGPFFLYMAPTLVHGPSAVKSLQTDRRTTPLGYVDVPDVQPSRPSVLDRARRAGAEEGRRIREKAAASIWLDDGVGAVLEKLDELGLAENTLVLLASDNGNVAKFTCYDGGARLPMVARWKDVIPAGAVCDQLVSNLDFAPTLFEIAGIKPPAEMTLDGQSIFKALHGDPSYRRDSLFLEITTERAVVTDDNFKYIAVRYLPEVQKQVDRGEKFNHWCQPLQSATHTYGADERYPGYFDQDQLYNLNRDAAERENLAGDPIQQARLAKMQELLRRYSATLPHTFGEFKTE